MTKNPQTIRLKVGGMMLLCIFMFTVGGHATQNWQRRQPETGIEAPTNSSSEYRFKAVFLYRLVRWVTWPTSNLSKTSKTLTIGIVGKDPFGREIDALTKLKRIKGRQIVIKRFPKVVDIKKTQVLFVSRSLSQAEVDQVIKRGHKESILIVGEKNDFVDQAGMISLLIQKNKLKFEVNTVSIKKAKLKVSSQILKMASRVVKKSKK